MSEHSGRHGKNEEFEALLRRLAPTPLEPERLDALFRHVQAQASSDRGRSAARLRWSRVVPFVLVCTMASFGIVLFRYGERFRADAAPPAAEIVSRPDRADAPLSRHVPAARGRMVPASSSEGIVETEEDREHRRSDDHDVYYWRDPKSGTEIRFFQPRSGETATPSRSR